MTTTRPATVRSKVKRIAPLKNAKLRPTAPPAEETTDVFRAKAQSVRLQRRLRQKRRRHRRPWR
jgi:hypothetical protein